MLWPVRHIIACFVMKWFTQRVVCLMIVTFENVMASEAYNCLFGRETILSAFCLIDDRDCENFIASEADDSLLGMKSLIQRLD